MCPLPERQKMWRYVHTFRNTILACDGQTDRIGRTVSRSACIAFWRAKKSDNLGKIRL